MKARALTAAAILTGGIAFATTAAHAADRAVTTPAPAGTATGAAAAVAGVLGIGQTGATANQNTATADANAITIGGQTIVGGTQTGTGQTSGALLDTGSTPLGRLQVAPYSASVTKTDTRRQADASSAAARADVVNPDVIHVDVLQSSSSATHTGPLSSGHAVSDGVVVRIGGDSGTTIRILHSEADSSGQGRTYLLAIGDQALLPGDFLEPVCALDLGPVLQLACMTVSGGVGGLTASDLNAVVAGLHVDAITSGVTGGVGGVVPAAEKARVLATTETAPAASGLARTGYDIWFLMFVAEALLALGAVALFTAKALGRVRVRATR